MTDRTRKIIQTIAQNNNVAPEEVEKEIRSAIQAGMSSNDPNVQAVWKQISPNGIEPTIDAFLDYMVSRVITQKETHGT